MRTASFTLFWAACVFALGVFTLAERQLVEGRASAWGPAVASALRSRPFARWDSALYLDIARNGYEWKDDRGLHNAGFFPLYPIAIAAVSKTTSLPPDIAGQLASAVFLLAAVSLVSRLARREGFDDLSTVQAMLFFPASFFFVSVYSESLFLLCAAGSLLELRRERPVAAGLWGFLAALTRPTGIVLVLPAAWAAGEVWKRGERPATGRWAAAVLGPCAGLAAFATYLWARFGTPWAYVRAHRDYFQNGGPFWPWVPLVRAFTWTPHHRIEVVLALAFGGLAVVLYRRGFRLLAVYVGASVVFMFETAALFGALRYLEVVFPAFFLIGEAMDRRPWFRGAYSAAALLALAYSLARFVTGLWVA